MIAPALITVLDSVTLVAHLAGYDELSLGLHAVNFGLGLMVGDGFRAVLGEAVHLSVRAARYVARAARRGWHRLRDLLAGLRRNHLRR